MPRLMANPVMSPPPSRSPNQMSTPQVMRVEKFPSRIAGHARLNPTSIDDARVRPMRTSSFIRSKDKDVRVHRHTYGEDEPADMGQGSG